MADPKTIDMLLAIVFLVAALLVLNNEILGWYDVPGYVFTVICVGAIVLCLMRIVVSWKSK